VDERVRDSRQGTKEGQVALSDLVAIALGFHGTICATSVLGIVKLGGESKFGTEKVADLHGLRPRLLKRLVSSLELSLNPILTTASSVESLERDQDGHPKPMPARLSVTGKEALTNAVRDFVKSDNRSLLDLREAQILNDRLNQSLDWLRNLVWMLAVFTGAVSFAMIFSKCEWINLSSAYWHVLFSSFLIVLLALIFWVLRRTLMDSSQVDKLKSGYVDIP
jgi:hypothetical protein